MMNDEHRDVEGAAISARARGDADAERTALDTLIRLGLHRDTPPLITDEDVRRAAGAMPHDTDACSLTTYQCQRQRLVDAERVLNAAVPALRARLVAEVLNRIAADCGQPMDDSVGDLTVSAVPVTRLRALAAQYQAGER